ncbi:uncharacterized protein [Palaemon carinicauda]
MLKKPSSMTAQTPVPSEDDEDERILTANNAGGIGSLFEEYWSRPLVFQKYVDVNGYEHVTRNREGNGGLKLSARNLAERGEKDLKGIRFEMQENPQEGDIKAAVSFPYDTDGNRFLYDVERNNLSTNNDENRVNSLLSVDGNYDHNESLKKGILILGPLYEGTREEELQNERNIERISYKNDQDDRTWVRAVKGEIIDKNNWQNERKKLSSDNKGRPFSDTNKDWGMHSISSHGTWIQEALDYTRSENSVSNGKEYWRFSHYPTAEQQLFCQLQKNTEHEQCPESSITLEDPLSNQNKLELEENGPRLHIRHHSKRDDYTSQNKINKIQSYYAKAPDPLPHSWMNMNKKKPNSLGRKVQSRIGDLQELKLLGMFQDFKVKEREQRVGIDAKTRKVGHIGEKGRNIVNGCHKQLIEKLPNHVTVSNPKKETSPNWSKETSPNWSSCGDKQRNKCFYTNSEQYWMLDPLSQNAGYLEPFQISQDSNNNCSDWYSNKDLKYLFYSKPQPGILSSSKKICNIQYVLPNSDYTQNHDNQPTLRKTFANFMTKLRYLYSIYKYSGHKKMKLRNLLTANMIEQPELNDSNFSQNCTIKGYIRKNIFGQKVPIEQDADQDQSGNGGRRQWEKSKSNKENNFAADDDAASIRDKGGSDRRSSSVHSAVKPTTNMQRSFDVDYRGRQRKPKGQKLYQRSISSDEDKSYGAIAHTVKYRDKDLLQRPYVSDVPDSSKDLADSLKGLANKRLSKSHERKRTNLRYKKESTSELHSRDASHSRRKYAKTKSEDSTSSQSSSSSCSSSRARSATKPAPRIKRKSIPKETVQTGPSLKTASSYDERYDQTQFLARLDSVLSDLVENEKKKISKYGHPRLRDIRHANSGDFLSTKASHKKEDRYDSRKKSAPEVSSNMNPSVQQLRATLRAVRVKKLTPVTCDLLEKHAERFTERLPHNPRILKSQVSSNLLAQRCYQPPKQKSSRNNQDNATADYASDFYSSDEEPKELQTACQKDLPSINAEPKEYQEKFEETDIATDEKEENDTCSGSDNPMSKRYALNYHKKMQETTYKSHHGDVGDSGDFSVDSAYTGSRGATPENVLTSTVKCRSLGGSLTTALPAMRFYSSYRHMARSERLIELKRSILYDIKQSKLYSDESINSLLEEYKRKCCDVSAADVQEVILSVQEDLGVKPRPDHYICHLLQAADERRQGAFESNLTTDTATPETQSPNSNTVEDPYALKVTSHPVNDGDKGSNGRLKKNNSKQDLEESGILSRKSESSEKSTTLKAKNYQRLRHSREEKEDKAWAEVTLGDVAPTVVAEAAQAQVEAKSNTDDSDQDWSGYVTDLCQQFDIKI